MEQQPGQGDEAGEPPRPGPGTPGVRDERLAGFAAGGKWDACPPSGHLAALIEEVGGPRWRCPGAEPGELIGVLRRLAAVESWVAAAKLGVIRELIRADDIPAAPRPRHGDLPDAWSDSLNHELALALACSVGSAEKTALLAWELGARLPRTAALLADGTLSYGKARYVAEAFEWLSDGDAARADELLAARLAAADVTTFGQLANLAARVAAEVDPGLAERRRKAAVKHRARVRLFREDSGTAGLSGRDLPPDEALAADANIAARAGEYKDSGVFDGARMDQLRVTAYLDLINGVPAWERIASGRLATDDAADTPAGAPGGPDPDRDDRGCACRECDSTCRECNGTCRECDGTCRPPGDDEHEDREDLADPEGPQGPDGGCGPESGRPDGDRLAAARALTRLVDLVIPLATLLGLAERPGESHGLGVLDPGLCRYLAAAAAASQRTELCVTVTDPDGIAVGHGCARPTRNGGRAWGQFARFPARVNLTVTADLLAELSGSAGPPGSGSSPPGSWALTRKDAAGPEPADGYGTWTLTLPDGRALTVRLERVPTFDCDHRYESAGYQPSGKLRHLVQVRDYACTNPVCGRHARESDFEHALPFHKGGRTCACNAGARSRKCHRMKQSPGWDVTQPRPGWHRWTTPAGRVYTQGPHRYPV